MWLSLTRAAWAALQCQLQTPLAEEEKLQCKVRGQCRCVSCNAQSLDTYIVQCKPHRLQARTGLPNSHGAQRGKACGDQPAMACLLVGE